MDRGSATTGRRRRSGGNELHSQPRHHGGGSNLQMSPSAPVLPKPSTSKTPSRSAFAATSTSSSSSSSSSPFAVGADPSLLPGKGLAGHTATKGTVGKSHSHSHAHSLKPPTLPSLVGGGGHGKGVGGFSASSADRGPSTRLARRPSSGEDLDTGPGVSHGVDARTAGRRTARMSDVSDVSSVTMTVAPTTGRRSTVRMGRQSDAGRRSSSRTRSRASSQAGTSSRPSSGARTRRKSGASTSRTDSSHGSDLGVWDARHTDHDPAHDAAHHDLDPAQEGNENSMMQHPEQGGWRIGDESCKWSNVDMSAQDTDPPASTARSGRSSAASPPISPLSNKGDAPLSDRSSRTTTPTPLRPRPLLPSAGSAMSAVKQRGAMKKAGGQMVWVPPANPRPESRQATLDAVLDKQEQLQEQAAAAAREVELMKQQVALRDRTITELRQDVEHTKQAHAKVQETLEMVMEQKSRLKLQNAALMEELDNAKENLTRAGGSGLTETAVAAAKAAELRKVDNDVEFLKKQLEAELLHRAEIEASFEKRQTKLQNELSTVTQELETLRASSVQAQQTLEGKVRAAEELAHVSENALLQAQHQFANQAEELSRARSKLDEVQHTLEIKETAVTRLQQALADAEAAAVSSKVTLEQASGTQATALEAAQALLRESEARRRTEIASLEQQMRDSLADKTFASAKESAAWKMAWIVHHKLLANQRNALTKWRLDMCRAKEREEAERVQANVLRAATAEAVITTTAKVTEEVRASVEASEAEKQAAAVAKVREEHQQALKDQQVAHEQATLHLTSTLKAREQEMEALREQSASQLAEAAAMHEDAMAALRKEKEEELQAVAEEARRLESMLTDAVKSAVTEKEELMAERIRQVEAAGREALEQAGKQADAAAQIASQEFAAALVQKNAEHAEELQRLRTAHKLELARAAMLEEDAAGRVMQTECRAQATIATAERNQRAMLDLAESQYRKALQKASVDAEKALENAQAEAAEAVANAQIASGEALRQALDAVAADKDKARRDALEEQERLHRERVREAEEAVRLEEQAHANKRVEQLDKDWSDRWAASHKEREEALALEREENKGIVHELRDQVACLKNDLDVTRKTAEVDRMAAEKLLETSVETATRQTENRVKREEGIARTQALLQLNTEWESKMADTCKKYEAAREAIIEARVQEVQEEMSRRLEAVQAKHQTDLADLRATEEQHRKNLLETMASERAVDEARHQVALGEAAEAARQAEKKAAAEIIQQLQAEAESLKRAHRAELEKTIRDATEANGRVVADAVSAARASIIKDQQAAMDLLESRHRRSLEAAADRARAAAKEALELKDAEIEQIKANAEMAARQAKLEATALLDELREQHAQDAKAASARLRKQIQATESVEEDLEREQTMTATLRKDIQRRQQESIEQGERAGMAAEDVLSGCIRDLDGVLGWSADREVRIRAELRQDQECALMAEAEANQREKEHLERVALQRIDDAVADARAIFQSRLRAQLEETETRIQTLRHEAAKKLEEETTRLEAAKSKALEEAETRRKEAVAAFLAESQQEREDLAKISEQKVAAAISTTTEKAKAEMEAALEAQRKDWTGRLKEREEQLRDEAAQQVEFAIKRTQEQAEREQAAVVQEVQAETDQLVASIERAMKSMERERDLYGRSNDELAAQVVISRAKLERQEALIKQLKQCGAVAKVQMAMVHCRYISRYQADKQNWEHKLAEAAARAALYQDMNHSLVAMKDSVQETLESNRRELLIEHKAKLTTLQDEIKQLYKTRAEKTKVKEKYKQDIGAVEGGIRNVEKEERLLANMSAIRDGRVDPTISLNKKRLASELDTLIDRLQDRQKMYMKIDEELQALEAVIEGKEAQVNEIESHFIETLVSQQDQLSTIVRTASQELAQQTAIAQERVAACSNAR